MLTLGVAACRFPSSISCRGCLWGPLRWCCPTSRLVRALSLGFSPMRVDCVCLCLTFELLLACDSGTAERVEAEGDVATAFTLARIISNIPLARGGPASVVIFDIHALQGTLIVSYLCQRAHLVHWCTRSLSWCSLFGSRALLLRRSGALGLLNLDVIVRLLSCVLLILILTLVSLCALLQVLPLFESGIPLLRSRLRQLEDAESVAIAYPDEGAW